MICYKPGNNNRSQTPTDFTTAVHSLTNTTNKTYQMSTYVMPSETHIRGNNLGD